MTGGKNELEARLSITSGILLLKRLMSDGVW